MPKFLKYWRNPLGIGLAVLHALLLLGVLLAKEPLPAPRSDDDICPPDAVCFDSWDFAGQSVVARRPFHFHYEPLIVKCLMLVDLPGLLVADLVLGVMTLLVKSRETQSYISAFGWFIFASLQWWAVGTYVHMRRSLRKSNR